MKPLSKKAKMAVGWTILMTVVGTAMLHQWQFFAMGCASKTPKTKNKPRR